MEELMDYTVTIELVQRNFERGVYKASTYITVMTQMGEQGLQLAANGSTPEKAIEHLRSFVTRARNGIAAAASF